MDKKILFTSFLILFTLIGCSGNTEGNTSIPNKTTDSSTNIEKQEEKWIVTSNSSWNSSTSNIPKYFIAIHNEPFHDEYKRDERLAAAYQTLKEMIKKADEYNIKYTLMFTAQWSDYISESEERTKELASWKTNWHEISAHHHDTWHGNWDWYASISEQEALDIRKDKGKNESYKWTIQDYYKDLTKIDKEIKSGCLNEEWNKDALPNEILYATCAGFLNSWEVGQRISDTEPKKAINDYITVEIGIISRESG